MLTRLTEIDGNAAPLPIENLDTDQIMPKQFLRIIDKAGLSEGLLYDLRFDAEGERRSDCVLNQTAYRGARILIGGSNFGCGSSREHAVWGLQQFGFEAVIARSFAEIFYSNAMNNRLLLVQLDREAVDVLMQDAVTHPAARLHIDIEQQTVTTVNGRTFTFPLGARHKQMVIEGMDTIDLTLASLPAIEAFERIHFEQHPWAAVL
ncbi:3-isopropylmalate dehydratase small subunit [Paraburkholderia nemoris]|uniref:3-isopropylmalate dehydratase small subunit n=1 Tax=Paraburkholderia nemoris TaxID=2793076 RepID=A0ABN7LC91_9BURK|nr:MULTISPECIES: 3-isopropylmalate dehydratase small subunit [Paraburkholderia]KPD16087.1 3-isopropylmalate dehydratase [Burkholderia sp. ST111]MBK5148006.1 3-isopropylmalate dehydratase small subunit [Burkholderia sp. R-69608]MBK3810954.1 3-isopropylmalate dehydratase small subunit [Paraburkholderia aspalathi]CAE6742796.1 3-isopropylmalate dehydratase small subunit 1 [Paraburkholderia nemoris]CAE6752931.1 3-isopropylmalate dehydratase small subunit 1 [Paraburkholderia nemoris]